MVMLASATLSRRARFGSSPTGGAVSLGVTAPVPAACAAAAAGVTPLADVVAFTGPESVDTSPDAVPRLPP